MPLEPCPFCGLTDRDAVSPDMGMVPAVALHSYPGVYRVQCEGCGCNGPMQSDSTAAVAAWNRRATTDELQAVVTRYPCGPAISPAVPHPAFPPQTT